MRVMFMASLCYEGAHGGGLWLTDSGVEYKTNKIQLPEMYRRIYLPYAEIVSVQPAKALSFIPAVVLETLGGERYKFIVFGRKKFFEVINKQINRYRKTDA